LNPTLTAGYHFVKMLLRKFYYHLPPQLRLSLRRIWYLLYDLLHTRERKRQLQPPKGLIYTGSGDFIAVGKKFLGYFIQFANLQVSHDVLDVGSGIGRMAVPLTGFLERTAQYDGFDVVAQGVRWCRKHITPAYPNFHFHHVDLSNDLYKANGEHASGFVFPFESHRYDRAIVISVFTHMTRPEVAHYLSEIHRVLRQGGIVFATFFILNEQSRAAMRPREFRFDYPLEDGSVLMDPHVVAANVAFEEDALLEDCGRAGFTIKQVLYGKWSGRKGETLDFQDILILEKPTA